MTRDQIKNIPKDRVVTYVGNVVDFRPQKADTIHAHITAGGNLIVYSNKLTTELQILPQQNYYRIVH